MKKFKRALSLVLALTLIVSCLSLSTFAASTSNKWDGWTAISNATQLRNIENNMSGKYYLTNDITLPSSWTPIGFSTAEIKDFYGTFDGNGYTISGLNYSTNYGYVGLFSSIESTGVVQNFTLTVKCIKGNQYIGSVAGYNDGTIQNVSVAQDAYYYDNVYATSTNRNYPGLAGGIAGRNGGKILNCEAAVNVRASDYAGGIAGQNWNEIRECYAMGGVNYSYTGSETIASNYAGGLVGGNAGTIEDCFVALKGFVKGRSYVGGLAGYTGAGSIKHCYVVITDGGVSWENGGSYNNVFIGKFTNTAVEQNFTHINATANGASVIADNILKNTTTFPNNYATTWDWDNVWMYNNNDGYAYPKLQNVGNPGHTEEPTEYTVTYTDGVPGVNVFPDQGYEGLKEGDTTPGFVGTPTREGYTFMGWYPAVNPVISGADANENGEIIYTATWQKNAVKYTVTYTDGVEGETVFEDQVYTVEEGSATPAFVGTPTREGYTFLGWTPEVAATVTGNATYTATWKQNEKYLHVVNSLTGAEIAKYTQAEVDEIDITTLAYDLDCVNSGEYIFAGWFTEPQAEDNWDRTTWASKSVKGLELAADDSSIYAWYIKAGYAGTTIAYTSNEKKASKLFTLSTVPGDIFTEYGFLMSTASGANDSTLVKNATIDGLKVKDVSKTTVWDYIAVGPFTNTVRANAFNGGLGGANNGNGYLTYSYITNVALNKTLSARAYYTTLEGTLVYGPTASAELIANNNVTGLE